MGTKGFCTASYREELEEIQGKLEEENRLLYAEISNYHVHMIESRKKAVGLMRELFSERSKNLKKDRRMAELECGNMHLKVELECAEKEKLRNSKIRCEVQRENELLKDRLKLYQKEQQEDLFKARKRALDKY